MSRYSIRSDGSIVENQQTPAEQREFLIYYAKVMLREAHARRGQRVQWMLDGAAQARREAAAIDVRPAQGALL